jgi:predicted phosphodiesterase
MENNLKIIIATFVILAFTMNSCYDYADYSGFIRSSDRVNDRYFQSMAWNDSNNVTQFSIDENNYSISITSDSHNGTTVNFQELCNQFDTSESIALVLDGDIVTGKVVDYDSMKNQIDKITKPVFCMVGNHELFFDGWKTFYKYFGSSMYYFTVQTTDAKDIIICLDSGGGTFGNLQLDWLESLLKETRNNYRYCTVISHVSILRNWRSSNANPLIEEVSLLLDMFANYNVNYVINGHDHYRNVDKFGSTNYILTDALIDSNPNPSYLNLIVTDSAMDIEYVDLH